MKQFYTSHVRFAWLVIICGISAGFVAILFHKLIAFIHNILFYGQFSTYSPDMLHVEPSAWGAGVIFVPVAGALIVAFVVKTFAPEARGSGVPEVIDSIHFRDSRIRPIVSLVKALASSITIGSGGSAGREGPIIQIGATVGSTLGQWVQVKDWQRMTLVACGAGGGIAATFNTPFAGILFAVEIMLIELSMRTIVPVCIATAIATYVSYLDFSSAPFFGVSKVMLVDVDIIDVFVSVMLSIFLGLISFIFIHSIYWMEDIFNKIPGNYYLRHSLGMFIVGIILYLMLKLTGYYYVGGVGYATVMDVLKGSILNPQFLLLLVIIKILVTAITLGSGGSGGVFSPLLFIGACFGACFAMIFNQYFISEPHINVQFSALAGMAGMVAATTSAPLTAIIMSAELVQDYKMTLPFIIIVGISCLVRRLLIQQSVYTMKLKRRGRDVSETLLSLDKI